MIVVWFNNYVSKHKETFFIDTADLTHFDSAGVKHEATAEAVNDIMSIAHTNNGYVVATADKMDFPAGKYAPVKSLHELVQGYSFRRSLRILANGTRGRLHRIDPHHAIVAQVIRNLKKTMAPNSYGDKDMMDIDLYFKALYNYSPFDQGYAKP